jgi:hypothetical protein
MATSIIKNTLHIETICEIAPSLLNADYQFNLNRSITNAKALIVNYLYGLTGNEYSQYISLPLTRPAALGTIIENVYSTININQNSDWIKVYSNGSVSGVYFKRIEAVYY